MPPLARLLALAPALLLAACAAPAPAAPAESPRLTFTGTTWMVEDAPALIAALPPPQPALPPAPPPPPDPALLDAWREPASPWLAAALRAIVADGASPPRAARTLMLTGVALNDALSVAAEARARGVEVSDHAAAAEAAARVLAAAHPLRADALKPLQEAGTWAGVWRGEAGVAEAIAGRHLGAAVAARVLAWAAADGANDVAAPRAAQAGPGAWRPTPPELEPPQHPAWGRVRTVAIGDPRAHRAPAPPAWGSHEMAAEIDAFVAAQAALDDAARLRAAAWAAGPGTATPGGLWAQAALELAARHGLSGAEAAGVYAALGVALHDAAVACWESKFHYGVARPIQAMAERDATWAPLLTTPPHPSYPSGHAALSGAASAVLAAAFPGEAEALRQRAAEAARSRVEGGIHWPMDGAAGLEQGAQVGRAVLARLTGTR
jgi:membrane-associated phospholipid phosphatase